MIAFWHFCKKALVCYLWKNSTAGKCDKRPGNKWWTAGQENRGHLSGHLEGILVRDEQDTFLADRLTAPFLTFFTSLFKSHFLNEVSRGPVLSFQYFIFLFPALSFFLPRMYHYLTFFVSHFFFYYLSLALICKFGNKTQDMDYFLSVTIFSALEALFDT